MQKKKKSILVLSMVAAFIVAWLLIPGLSGAGDMEPSGPPGSTMHSLEKIYDNLVAIERELKLNRCLTIGRFCDLGDGTVVDGATGLIWLKNANCFGAMNWGDAMGEAAALADGACGLTDGSEAGDWRLPTIEELRGIGTNPPVGWEKPGSPFSFVQSDPYWSSTPSEDTRSGGDAWLVNMADGGYGSDPKDSSNYVWPVRPDN